eukprot:7062868-Prymnesium_polylepis.1
MTSTTQHKPQAQTFGGVAEQNAAGRLTSLRRSVRPQAHGAQRLAPAEHNILYRVLLNGTPLPPLPQCAKN